MQLANNIFSKNEIKKGLILFLKTNMRKDDVFSQILYNKFKNDSKIRWKDSIRKMLNLPGEKNIG